MPSRPNSRSISGSASRTAYHYGTLSCNDLDVNREVSHQRVVSERYRKTSFTMDTIQIHRKSNVDSENIHEVLGCSTSTDFETLTKAYRDLSRKVREYKPESHVMNMIVLNDMVFRLFCFSIIPINISTTRRHRGFSRRLAQLMPLLFVMK
jgi:hypothetical protein